MLTIIWPHSVATDLQFVKNCSDLWSAIKLGMSIIKTFFTKKNKVGRFRLSDFQSYYKATTIQTVSYWHKDRYIDQWSIIESSEIKPSRYMFKCFLIRVPTLFKEKRTVISTNGAGKTGYLYAKEWSWILILHYIPKLTQKNGKQWLWQIFVYQWPEKHYSS